VIEKLIGLRLVCVAGLVEACIFQMVVLRVGMSWAVERFPALAIVKYGNFIHAKDRGSSSNLACKCDFKVIGLGTRSRGQFGDIVKAKDCRQEVNFWDL
jgi:hypothetical protein